MIEKNKKFRNCPILLARRVSTSFELLADRPNNGRKGILHFGKQGKIATPCLFPAMCIMTGPPGFGRQGAHYKYIKRTMCMDPAWRQTAFLSEILHFTDYMGSKEALERWLQMSFQDWMDEMLDLKGDQGDEDEWFDWLREYFQSSNEDDWCQESYEACFFLDSGGYKLLSNSDFSIEKYGYPTDPASIFELQSKMGADIVASLDYPLAPVDYKGDALWQLQKRSMDNALWLYDTLSKNDDPQYQPLAYLAVHGINYESTKEYTGKLLNRIDRKKAKYERFGFAIGSLVPRRANRALVVSIIKGALDAISEHKSGKYSDKPIHAFGMSGDILPTLVMLGVDTFDSNSFVQSGKNIRYVMPPSAENTSSRQSRTIHEISEAELKSCGCRACSKCLELGQLEDNKNLAMMARDKRHNIDGSSRKRIKSEVYAFLALHNLEMEFREIEALKMETDRGTLDQYVLNYAEKSSTRGALIKAYEAATGAVVEPGESREVSLKLTRDSFAIPESYKPPTEKEILLFLPCTKDKPYKESRSHKAIASALHNDSRVHVVTISGLYGPVPEELEDQNEVLLYDYVLSPEANDQISFIQSRVADYIERFGNDYRHIFGYVTVRAYRETLKKAFKECKKGTILPKKPTERTTKEFLLHKNIKELQSSIGEFLNGVTFNQHQLQLDIDSN